MDRGRPECLSRFLLDCLYIYVMSRKVELALFVMTMPTSFPVGHVQQYSVRTVGAHVSECFHNR
jgi:hypothetical protein